MKLKRPYIKLVEFVATLALFSGAVWFNWWHTNRMQETAELVARTHDVQAKLNRLLSLIEDIEAGSRGFVEIGRAHV